MTDKKLAKVKFIKDSDYVSIKFPSRSGKVYITKQEYSDLLKQERNKVLDLVEQKVVSEKPDRPDGTFSAQVVTKNVLRKEIRLFVDKLRDRS